MTLISNTVNHYGKQIKIVLQRKEKLVTRLEGYLENGCIGPSFFIKKIKH